jgi:hypothetical protein
MKKEKIHCSRPQRVDFDGLKLVQSVFLGLIRKQNCNFDSSVDLSSFFFLQQIFNFKAAA